ncbi:MAG: hypothetical protein LBC86_00105 [Oscillospiraceae bacterium]|nr:hypothetical protein [Oscillospiraceae bacterium]
MKKGLNENMKLIAFILTLSFVLTFAACGSEPETAPDPRPTADSFVAPEIPDEFPSEEGWQAEPDGVVSVSADSQNFTWLVEPALEYAGISYCEWHDMFHAND